MTSFYNQWYCLVRYCVGSEVQQVSQLRARISRGITEIHFFNWPMIFSYEIVEESDHRISIFVMYDKRWHHHGSGTKNCWTPLYGTHTTILRDSVRSVSVVWIQWIIQTQKYSPNVISEDDTTAYPSVPSEVWPKFSLFCFPLNESNNLVLKHYLTL